VRICATCGQTNPDIARFCLACGSEVEASRPAAAEERRLVSVLFVDLVAFTSQSERADPEDVRAKLVPYYALLRREIERFGGTVEKFIGDAVMAVFGAPMAHEDDAERAVRAALRILDALEERRDEKDGALEVRAAVNTGEVLVALGASAGETLVTGDVVNTAARLQTIAPVNGLVVGAGTYRATANTIDYEPLDPVRVKGKDEPVEVWRATGARSRFGVDALRRSASPLIGREDELLVLKQAFRRCAQQPSVQLVTVTGEPGVGKSRLVEEFFAFIDEQPELISWRQGRSLPYGDGISFWALNEIVKAQCGILESDSPTSAQAKLAQSVEEAVEPAEREWVLARLCRLLGLLQAELGDDEQEQAFAAWQRFLEGIAAQGPLVLVLEDLHWADDRLLEFAEQLVTWSSDLPLLVLCTGRPELYDRRPDWGGGKRNSTSISLTPLSSTDTALLLGALLAQSVLPAETQRLLLERAGGNPLYAEEFVRMLQDRGLLESRGAVATALDEEDVPIPETLQALIAARLDTLPTHRKSLLQDASVFGKVFWAGAVSHASGDDRGHVEGELRALAERELVRRARTSSVEGETEYAFAHLLVRDVAYAQIPRARRSDKHRAAADWIQRLAGDRVADHAELLAYHYCEALTLARAAGEDTAASGLDAVTHRFLMLAGDRAAGLDVARAEEHYRRALELAAPRSPERLRALINLGEAVRFGARPREAAELLREAVTSARPARDDELKLQALLALAGTLAIAGDARAAIGLMDEAVATLARDPSNPVLAGAYALKAGLVSVHLGDYPAAIAAAEKALGTASASADARTRATGIRGYSRCASGDLGGLDDLRAAVRIGIESSAATSLVVGAYVNLADWLWYSEGPAEALATIELAIELGERRGVRSEANWARAETLWFLYDLGEWDALLAGGDALFARYGRDEHELVPETLVAVTYRARVAIERGLPGAGSAFVRAAREMRDQHLVVPAVVTAARVEASAGRAATVRELLHEFESLTEGSALWRGQHVHEAVRIALTVDALDLAERLVAADVAYPAPRQRFAATSARAALAEAHGELDRAGALYEEAAGAWSAFGCVPERAEALAGLARCHGWSSAAAAEARAEATQLRARLGAAPLEPAGVGEARSG
jgi:class 3 adenylate cyclase/tetratricopeptide (TPR) repeat protein